MRHAARNALLLWAAASAASRPAASGSVAGAATGLGDDGASGAFAPPPGCWEPKLELDLSPPAQGLPRARPHPRLRLNDSALQRLNATIHADSMAQRLFQSMHDRGVAMLDEPPAYSIVDLTAAYRKQGATRVQRGFAFTAGFKQLLCAWPLGIVADALLTGVCVSSTARHALVTILC